MHSRMLDKMLTGKYLRIEGFQVNFNFSLNNAQIVFNENTLLMFFITGGKIRKG